MLFINRTNSAAIESAIDGVEEFLTSSAVEAIISRVEYFDMSTIAPLEVLRLVKDYKKPMKVYTYGRWYQRYSKAYAYTRGRDVYLNKYKLNRSIASLAGSLLHEAVHVADAHSNESFGHGNNSSVGKEMTAPYYIGRKCKMFLSAGV